MLNDINIDADQAIDEQSGSVKENPSILNIKENPSMSDGMKIVIVIGLVSVILGVVFSSSSKDNKLENVDENSKNSDNISIKHNDFNNNIDNDDQNPRTEVKKIISNYNDRLKNFNTKILSYLETNDNVTKEIYYKIYNEYQVLISPNDDDWYVNRLFDNLTEDDKESCLSFFKSYEGVNMIHIINNSMASLSSKYYNSNSCFAEMREV